MTERRRADRRRGGKHSRSISRNRRPIRKNTETAKAGGARTASQIRHEKRMAKQKRKRLLILGAAVLLIGAGILYGISQIQAVRRAGPPTITLKGEQTLTLNYGETYTDPGVTARDCNGKDLTGKVEVTVPDMPHSGTYDVVYKVTDSEGRETEVTRQVDVVFPAQTWEGAQRGLSVLMYHYVYDDWNPPYDLSANHCSRSALEAQLQYLIQEGYYFPTWDEVRDYVDGKIDLPEKSVVLTFDDGADDFRDYGVPLIEQYNVEATAFIISGRNGEQWASMDLHHLHLESHSHDMHKPGGYIGHGGIMTALTVEEQVADLKMSIETLGSGKALAYPYGDVVESNEMAAQEAGFLVAFTTQSGKVYPGMDPYALPRMRVAGSPTIEEYQSLL